MVATHIGTRIAFKNVLFSTDFSGASEAALPFALAIARRFGAKLYTFHVLTPMPYDYSTPMLAETLIEAQEEGVRNDMQRLESQLSDVPHEAIVELGLEIWPIIEREAAKRGVDLLVLYTNGLTGAKRLLLGSVAEEVFRRSLIPGGHDRAACHQRRAQRRKVPFRALSHLFHALFPGGSALRHLAGTGESGEAHTPERHSGAQWPGGAPR